MHFEQTIYYWNIPGVEDKKGFLNNFSKTGFFNSFGDNPIFLYTGLDNIPFGSIDVDYNTLTEIDFYLYEPVTYYHIEKQFNCNFYHEDKWEENHLLRAKELDSLEQLRKSFNLKINVFTSDYNCSKYLQEYYPNLKLQCFDTFLRQVGIPGIHRHDINIDKKFYCANKRFALHRMLTIAHLQDKDGYYSWSYRVNDEYRNFAWLETEKINHNLKTNFNNIKDTQFKIDLNELIEINRLDECGVAPDCEHGHPDEMMNMMSKSCVAIVNETRYGQPTGYFSEKTLDHMRMLMPFVLVAQPYTLEYMKKLGFKTFDCLWDESYDTEENHTKRLDKIFTLIDHIDSYSLEELIQIRKNVNHITKYNREFAQIFSYNSLILS